MIAVPEVTLEEVAVATKGADLAGLAIAAAGAVSPCEWGGVIAATFSNPDRFPSLAVRVAGELGLPAAVPAFDLQMACSAYPYALSLAANLSAATGKRVLVIDGDVQTPLVDPQDHATGAIFSDAVTATAVSADPGARSEFDFLSRYDTALACPAAGPIRMDGFQVFSFVATEVSRFLRDFIGSVGSADSGLRSPDFFFAPHQAQPYMVRQLARSLGLEDRLVTIDAALKNPGSASIAMALAANAERLRGGRALVVGFGAGYSAAAGFVKLAPDFKGVFV